MAGKIVRKDKYLWGVITGLAYYVLTVDCLCYGKRRLVYECSSCSYNIFYSAQADGTLGGMLS